ncbi:NAD-dependent epimerase/dehydratase family protein [Nocardioides nematodiphilus]|uniref:NAD-dependent epimerase/dehydratase family protein n=1 Tax=Nocardioides nematodiphilus TaxID=2849669 RepID=UPI001CD985AA|nr:NAD-dependent epimerase/dehydratase family protein [Nocardioides nematodiphilus]MCA1984633.1 NAD-dependent epimerase/dehydratase family protein [Nocardioides nematodiphilus]
MNQQPQHSTSVIIGAGPVGTTIARRLADAGRPVRLLTRSGSGPEHALVERVSGDACDASVLAEVFSGAAAVFDCMHASAYDAKVWRRELIPAEAAVLEAAGHVGAVVVFPESVYSYGPVHGAMTEDLPRAASFGKPAVRTELLAARAASGTPTVSVIAADFYGPGAHTAIAGDTMLDPILAGKRVNTIGRVDLPHSWTYVPDLAAAMIRAADDESLWNTVLHAPTAAPATQREMAGLFAEAAGLAAPKIGGIPGWLMRAIGVVHRGTRELAEMTYQFERPYVLDSSASEARLGLAPTPLEVGTKATVAAWR